MQNAKDKYILLSGRAGAGKTDMLIAYANLYPETTFILSQEYTREEIKKNRNVNKKIKIVENLDNIDLSKFETICIDYVELFDKDEMAKLIHKLSQLDIRIIAASHMRPITYDINNIFNKYLS